MNPRWQVRVCFTSGMLEGGDGGLEKVRVLELCRRARPGCCCLAKTAPAKQKTDDGERGKPKSWLVCSFWSVFCVYPRGVSIGYGYHIVHDITHVAACCGCTAFLAIVSAVLCAVKTHTDSSPICVIAYLTMQLNQQTLFFVVWMIILF